MEVTKAKSTEKRSAAMPLSHGVGRRKAAVARVWLRRGKGELQVNGLDVHHYFDTDAARMAALKIYDCCPSASSYDACANVSGGGKCAQADAVRLGIARALVQLNEDNRLVLRQSGFLTVDARVKERKKYGQKAARRKFQFVKR